MAELAGVLLLDKPPGLTSHDVVNRVRKRLGIRKVGHGGTLDPDATGLLIVCVGGATKLLEYITGADKEYVAEVCFGESTTTDDASGETVAKADASHLRHSDIAAVLPEFTGLIEQRVPAYSAVHVDGQRAYQLARRGVDIELPLRQVEIHELDLLSLATGNPATAKLRVACSKGTYIRSLCRDLGLRLGIPAHMAMLRRTKSGSFTIGESIPLEQWEQHPNPKDMLIAPVDAVPLPRLDVPQDLARRLAQGQKVWTVAPSVSVAVQGASVAVVASGILAAVALVLAVRDSQWVLLRPAKVFWEKDG